MSLISHKPWTFFKSGDASEEDSTETCDQCLKRFSELNEFKTTSESYHKTVFVCNDCADLMEMDTNQFWKRVL